jgi:formylglycine-generating enzyme required for sulfatase activity
MLDSYDFHSTCSKIFPVMILSALLFFPVQGVANVTKKLAEGDKALAKSDLSTAETAYAEALKLEPENYRILRSLAEVKVSLSKYNEADVLIEKIIAMKVLNGRRVLVTREGDTQGQEAELVDETVILLDKSKNNMRNYLSRVEEDVIPNYRLFFLKSGKMELIPKNQVKIQYLGVPRRVHELMVELQREVKNKVMAAGESQGPEEMVSIKGGCFQMGSDKGASDEQPVHEVCLKDYKIDKYEVTQQAFQLKMGTNSSRFKGANLPMESATWLEAEQYCVKSGKRLPTEAEWEYAARAGTTTRYYWGDEFDPKMANFCDSSCDLNIRSASSDGFKHTAPVGSFPPNPWGLHDMAGNVNEWTNDWFQERYYVIGPKDNPKGPIRHDATLMKGATNEKMFRGGAWENGPDELRSASRKSVWTDYRIEGLGFRCASD